MAKGDPTARIKTILTHFGPGDKLSERVRRTLVRTLYNQPASLAIGALAGIFSAGVVALGSGEPSLCIAAVALAIVAIVRVTVASNMSPDDDGNSTWKLEIIYEIGAFSYAMLLGTVAALTLLLNIGTQWEVLMTANAMCYGVGICARNAGRPAIALGQLTLTVVPVMVVCLYIGTLAYVTLAVTIALLLPAMASITLNVFKILRDSISAAETSALLADRMQTLARTDVVTGLANRAGLNHAMVETLMDLPEGRMLALFWLDLDRFKEVNDLLGHPVGDRVLSEIARRLRAASSVDATVSRFGGDEFIILSEVSSRLECEKLAGRLLDEIIRPVRIDGDRLEVQASMGIAILPEDGIDSDTLMQRADLALYHAKVNGRNQLCFYTPAMSRDLVRRREIEAELRAAIIKNELSIFFQPIVDLETGKIRTFEALVRWFHPQKGELKPDEFIPVAEETGVIVTLGNWITAQAAKACAAWPEDVTLAVNLSPMQIKAPGAALGILTALRDAGLAPSRLELEVTESLFLDDNHATNSFIEELSAAGVRFALDDFGTGYSSLSYIHKYPFKKIKVDRSFVSGPNVGRKSDAIIRAVAELGTTLEMEIVAEGLETVEQVKAVREAGCTLGQGYYFSRAVPDYLAAMLLAQEREGEYCRAEAQRKTG
ncbi:putative bifunctional diguanylate cyclase/phosphodiesterase [Allopontixanthobacter sediminis]|uniref:EAL domain-containing protein n=1 Tax=Allopontixanthobacter sediminis TaxID=1689985 RepID=A0A845AZF9_9SPHN|nr:EAL domain-containing protein [Allopontixanthobacter sediminis]MXP43316.1 EAL domain-containing protein [Allopontixanthobacter sediminis]